MECRIDGCDSSAYCRQHCARVGSALDQQRRAVTRHIDVVRIDSPERAELRIRDDADDLESVA
jgi:hypothetical protein